MIDTKKIMQRAFQVCRSHPETVYCNQLEAIVQAIVEAVNEDQKNMRTIGAFVLAQGILANPIIGTHKVDVPKLFVLTDEIIAEAGKERL